MASLVTLVGVVGIVNDAVQFGVGIKSGAVLSLIESLNHCIAYRNTTQAIVNGQRWWSVLLTIFFLKRVAGWVCLVVEGKRPELDRGMQQSVILLTALILVQMSVAGNVYKELRSPNGTLVLSVGGAIYRWRKLLFVADLHAYQCSSWQIFVVALLVVDGTSLARKVAHWTLQQVQNGSGRDSSTFVTLTRASRFFSSRIIPTWFCLVLTTWLSDNGRVSLTQNLGAYCALVFYLHSFRVFHHVLFLVRNALPSNDDASSSCDAKVAYEGEDSFEGEHGDSTTEEGTESEKESDVVSKSPDSSSGEAQLRSRTANKQDFPSMERRPDEAEVRTKIE